MFTRFMAVTNDGVYGHFGCGDTLEEALKTLKASGGEIRKRGDSFAPKKGYALTAYKFTSEYPFAPYDREATEEEADCWVNDMGNICSFQCQREKVEI